MKKFLVLAAVLMSASLSQAASSYGSRDTISGLLGFSQSAVAFGAQYEHRIDTMGVGGFFNYSSEQKNYPHNQLISFGAIAPFHLLDDTKYDVSFGPGFAITMVKGIYGSYPSDDVTVFGPVWKLAAYYKFTSNVKFGLEHTELVNWFSDKLPTDARYTNLALGFAF